MFGSACLVMEQIRFSLTKKAKKCLSYFQAKFNRPWDYVKNFGIYSQLDSKSKTWFFTFLKVYVS